MPLPAGVKLAPQGGATVTEVAEPPSTVTQTKEGEELPSNVEVEADPAIDKSPEFKNTINLDQFEKEFDLGFEKTAKPKVEEKKEEKKEEEVVETKPKIGRPALERDYSDLDDSEKLIFQKMSNEAYAKLYPLYKEHKTLKPQLEAQKTRIAELEKNALPSSYFQHPNGYVLDPSFTQLSENLSVTQVIENHWRTQLKKMEAGEDWQDLDIDENGKFKLSEPKPSDGSSKVDVLSYYQHAISQRQSAETKIKDLVSTFGEKHGKISSFVKAEIEDRFFPMFKDDVVNKPESKEIRESLAKVSDAFPEELRGNILMGTVAKQAVLIRMLHQALKAAGDSKSVDKLREDNKNIEQPKPSGVSSPTKKEKTVLLEDFRREMED